MFIYERLRRVHMCLKEEENACQVLAAVAVHALCRSFDMAVENKRGISNLELLYKEISRAEKAKELRKEQKKLKKKKKKNDKKVLENQTACANCELSSSLACSCEIDDEHGYDTEEQESMNCCNTLENASTEKSLSLSSSNPSCCPNSSDEISIDVKDEISLYSCRSCDANVGGCSKSIDGGYVSEPSSSNHDGPCSVLSSRTSSITSSPEGSEIACSDGFCNHDQSNGVHSLRTTPEYIARHATVVESPLTLQQMLVSSIRCNPKTIL